VSLCVVCVEYSSLTHTAHIFLMNRNYNWGWWYSGPLYFKEWICSISTITNFITQTWIYCLSLVDYNTFLAFSETSVSRYHGSLFETPRTSQHYRIEGFKGALNWNPWRRETPASRIANMRFCSLSNTILWYYARLKFKNGGPLLPPDLLKCQILWKDNITTGHFIFNN